MRPPTPTLGLPPLFLVDLRVVTTKIIFLFGIFFFFFKHENCKLRSCLDPLGRAFFRAGRRESRPPSTFSTASGLSSPLPRPLSLQFKGTYFFLPPVAQGRSQGFLLRSPAARRVGCAADCAGPRAPLGGRGPHPNPAAGGERRWRASAPRSQSGHSSFLAVLGPAQGTAWAWRGPTVLTDRSPQPGGPLPHLLPFVRISGR